MVGGGVSLGPSTPGAAHGVARARLDLCVCVLRVDAQRLGASLARLGPLALTQIDEHGRAAVCIELWDVRDGNVRWAGVDQAQWYAGAGMVMGSAYGALLGPLGSLSGALLGQRMGQVLSSAATHALGRYRELLIGVPEVRLRDEEPSSFVPGMPADTRMAGRGGRAVGYRSRHAQASFAGTPAGGEQAAVIVRDAQGPLLRAQVHPGCEPALELGVDWGDVAGWFGRPLLARAPAGLTRSTLTRTFPSGQAPLPHHRKHSATLQVGATLHPWLSTSAGEHTVAAFLVPDVAVDLSLPTPLPSRERDRHVV